MAQTSEKIIDTDILIDYLRGVPEARKFLDNLQKRCISAITAMEIIQGSRNKKELEVNLLFLEHFKVVRISKDVSDLAINLMEKHNLEYDLAIPDAIIAAAAIKKDGLLTKNLKHFEFIKKLEVETPY